MSDELWAAEVRLRAVKSATDWRQIAALYPVAFQAAGDDGVTEGIAADESVLAAAWMNTMLADVTPEHVEAAAKALYDYDFPDDGWSGLTEDRRECERRHARVAIAAYRKSLGVV